jgi:surface antigen
MRAKGFVAAVAVAGTLSLGASTATGPANSDATVDRTAGQTTDHNPLSDFEGYCTWGAQEQIHEHTGYYIKALTGNAEDWANQAIAAGWTVVGEPQPHSIAVFSSSLVGGVGHVAWVDAVFGNRITITEMNSSAGFHEFDTRAFDGVPGISYILIP